MTLSKVSLGDISLQVRQAGEGTPLLLVHGFPLDHQMWNFQFEALSSLYQLIAPDLRGFGGSSVSPGTMRMQDYADDLAKLLDALNIREPVVLCSLSMGGYVSLEFVQRHRSWLRGLILCDTRAAADSAEAAANRLKSADKVLSEGPAFLVEAMIPKLFGPTCLKERPDVVEQTRQVMLNTHPEAIAAALRGMAERPDSTAKLSSFDLPTLVLGGKEDAIVPTQEMAAMAQAIPHAKYVEIPNAGHMAPLEAPVEVNAALADFLETC